MNLPLSFRVSAAGARRLACLLAIAFLEINESRAATVVAIPQPDAPGQAPTLLTNVPSDLTNAVALGGNRYGLALRTDGRVTVWGNSNSPALSTTLFQVPADLTDAVAISDQGSRHALAVRRDGTVVGWGDYQFGKTEPPVFLHDVFKVAAGNDYGLALKKDGTVVAWGGHWDGETFVPVGLTGVVDIVSADRFAMALCRDGHVAAWGLSSSGQTAVPADLSNVVAITAELDNAAALRADGSVVWWGYTPVLDGQPTNWPPVVDIGWDRGGGLLGLCTNGTVVRWPNAYADPPIDSLSNVVVLSRGSGPDGLFIVRSPNEPFILQHPVSRTVVAGTSVTFSVSATAGQPLSYQWQFNNLNLRGATNSMLTITAAWPAQAGFYRAVVTAAGLPVKSRPALLVVQSGTGP
jgi:hypothetical protein